MKVLLLALKTIIFICHLVLKLYARLWSKIRLQQCRYTFISFFLGYGRSRVTSECLHAVKNILCYVNAFVFYAVLKWSELSEWILYLWRSTCSLRRVWLSPAPSLPTAAPHLTRGCYSFVLFKCVERKKQFVSHGISSNGNNLQLVVLLKFFLFSQHLN